MDKIKKLTTP